MRALSASPELHNGTRSRSPAPSPRGAPQMSARILSTRAKIVASAALLAAAAGAAGLGTFGSFTSTTSASESVTAGNVTIGLGAPGTPNNRLTVAATGVVPGDTIARGVVLSNTGDQALSAITLTTTASPSSVL